MDKHLKNVYGFNTFRGKQQHIINDLLTKKNVFAILPTGGGKSLLYQFPATFTDKITIVISPLISLMNDQCKYLNSKNIMAVCLNSESFVNVSSYINYKIIYTTPEFIMSRLQAFNTIKSHIGLFAIDEAHCVSQWSHDFRPSYQGLGIIKKKFPDIPLLAVTATATPRVLAEMYKFLNVKDHVEYSLGTRRTNLIIKVLPKKQFSRCTFKEPTIVYVQTRKLCEKLNDDLLRKGISSACYHGGMSKDNKNKSHELFINGKIIVIVATISFGMGIDKSDIRHVINYGVPANIESYYQEIGRAGRDGINSKATLFYNDNDFTTTSYLISLSKDEEQIKIKTKGMNTFRSYLQEKNICRQQLIDHYFATGDFACEEDVKHIPKCNMCDNCLDTDKQPCIDISTDANTIIGIIGNYHRKKGYNLGVKKTIALIKTCIKKSSKWVKDVLEILITKNVLYRYKAGFGFVIGVGDVDLKDILPVKSRADTVYKNNSLIRTMALRDKLAHKFNLVPSSFINDRVIMNIDKRSPKSMSELWFVDGISNEFMMTSHCIEFMDEYLLGKKVAVENVAVKRVTGKRVTGKRTSGKRVTKGTKTRESVHTYYKHKKSIKEISQLLQISEQTVEGHILYIYEHCDDEILMDYFDLTEEKEEKIKEAIKKVGLEKLKPIKEIVGDITYSQIKLYLLVMKIEDDSY